MIWFWFYWVGRDRERENNKFDAIFHVVFSLIFLFTSENVLSGHWLALRWLSYMLRAVFILYRNDTFYLSVLDISILLAAMISIIFSKGCFTHQHCWSTSWMRVQHEISHNVPISHSPQFFSTNKFCPLNDVRNFLKLWFVYPNTVRCVKNLCNVYTVIQSIAVHWKWLSSHYVVKKKEKKFPNWFSVWSGMYIVL